MPTPLKENKNRPLMLPGRIRNPTLCSSDHGCTHAVASKHVHGSVVKPLESTIRHFWLSIAVHTTPTGLNTCSRNDRAAVDRCALDAVDSSASGAQSVVVLTAHCSPWCTTLVGPCPFREPPVCTGNGSSRNSWRRQRQQPFEIQFENAGRCL